MQSGNQLTGSLVEVRASHNRRSTATHPSNHHSSCYASPENFHGADSSYESFEEEHKTEFHSAGCGPCKDEKNIVEFVKLQSFGLDDEKCDPGRNVSFGDGL